MLGSWWYLLLLVIGYTIIYIYQSIDVARYLQVYIGTFDGYHSSLFHCRKVGVGFGVHKSGHIFLTDNYIVGVGFEQRFYAVVPACYVFGNVAPDSAVDLDQLLGAGHQIPGFAVEEIVQSNRSASFVNASYSFAFIITVLFFIGFPTKGKLSLSATDEV